MTPEKFELLKKVLSVPTKTYKEGLMVELPIGFLKKGFHIMLTNT
jgi:hypothetical protein